MLASAIRVFIDSGLMETLEAGPTTADDLACRSHVAPAALGSFLAALEAGGVVRVTDDDPPQWRLIGDRAAWSTFFRESDRLRPFLDTGAAPGLDADREARGRGYGAVTEVLAEVTLPVARTWARVLAHPDLSVLEIGAGAAPFTRAFLDHQPSVRATVLDLEPMIAAHRDTLVAAYPGADLTFVGGDVFASEPNDSFDLVVMAAFCRLFPDDESELLLHRVAGRLHPGGEVLIADVVHMDDGSSTGTAIAALSLATRSRERVHRLSDFERWLRRSGFAPPSVHPAADSPFVVLVSKLGCAEGRTEPQDHQHVRHRGHRIDPSTTIESERRQRRP